MINIVVIIQARMGSTRLQGKVLREIEGIPILGHIINRLKFSKSMNMIITATTKNKIDDVIVEYCKHLSISCFRGNEENVLERFYKAAIESRSDIIVRITADDPLKDPEIIDRAIEILRNGNYDYVSNTIKPTYPEGLDTEVFTFRTLERAYIGATTPSEKEHVTPFIWKNPEKFKIFNFENDEDLSKLRWTLDTEDDFEFISKVYEKLYSPNSIFLMKDIIRLLKSHPELNDINKGHKRNEGYIKSVTMKG